MHKYFRIHNIHCDKVASTKLKKAWNEHPGRRAAVYTVASVVVSSTLVRKANAIGIPLQVHDAFAWGTYFTAGFAVPNAIEMLSGVKNFGRRLAVSVGGTAAVAVAQPFVADYLHQAFKGPIPFWAMVNSPTTMASIALGTGAIVAMGYKSYFRNFLRSESDSE